MLISVAKLVHGEFVLLLPFGFLVLLLACCAGVIYPDLRSSKRWHFALGAFASFVAFVVSVPEPTPEQLAAREAEEAREAHEEVVKKAKPALEGRIDYSRTEYQDTDQRVGSATFAKLNELEPGSAYAAAESKSCDLINVAMVSDTSKRGSAVWFVDCANEQRFMVSQAQAEDALARFKKGTLAQRDLEPSCSVADCTLTPQQKAAKAEELEVQKAAMDNEIEFVTACDLILERVCPGGGLGPPIPAGDLGG